MRKPVIIAVACALLVSAVAVRAQSTPPQTPRPAAALAIIVPSETRCVIQRLCEIQLRAGNATSPLRWRVVKGTLPNGLELSASTGLISGTAKIAGDYVVTIEVSDALGAVHNVQRTITITLLDIIVIDWQSAPALADTGVISGSLRVTNNSPDSADLTVVVVVVNQIGRATTLGYQHFTIAAGATSPTIPFGAGQPMSTGRYRLRVDAVAEVAAKNVIYRSAREAGPYTIP